MFDKLKIPFYLSVIWYPIWETCGLVMEGTKRSRFAVLGLNGISW